MSKSIERLQTFQWGQRAVMAKASFHIAILRRVKDVVLSTALTYKPTYVLGHHRLALYRVRTTEAMSKSIERLQTFQWGQRAVMAKASFHSTYPPIIAILRRVKDVVLSTALTYKPTYVLGHHRLALDSAVCP
jgi:hypothetical protein